MPFFCCQLIPPRTTFPFDMTEAERERMSAHADHIRNLIGQGLIRLAGPVLDPKGSWGLVVGEAQNEQQMRDALDADPIVRAGWNFRYDIHSMPSLLSPVGAINKDEGSPVGGEGST